MSVIVSRITRELDPGIANFRNLRQEWFLLGAIGDLNGEPVFYTYHHLILNSVEEPLKRAPFKLRSYTRNIFATSLAYFFFRQSKMH